MATTRVRPALSTLVPTVVLLLVGTVLTATAGPASAASNYREVRPVPAATGGVDATLDLGLTGFTDLTIDPGTGRLFISPGGDASVVVVEADGSRRRQLDVAGGDQLVPDATGVLWTTHARNHTVSRIDPVTLEVATWQLEQCMPLSAVRVRDHVLVGAERCGDGSSESMRAFPAATPPGPVPTARVPVQTDSWTPHDDLIAVPGDPDSVYADGYNEDMGRYVVEDTDTGPRMVLAARPVTSSWRGYEVGGTGVLIGTNVDEAFTLDPQTLEPLSVVPGVQRRVVGAAQRTDGLLAIAEDDPDLSLFRDGVLWRSYELPALSTYDEVVGLGFGEETLYAVTANTYRGTGYRLHLVTPRDASVLTLDRGPVERLTGRPISLDLHLEGAPAGSEVVVRGRSRGRWSELGRGTTDAAGHLQLQGTLVHSTLFEATYAGTPTIDPATTRVFAMARGRVRNRMVGATGTRRGVAVYRDGGTAVLSFAVEPDSHRGDCVRVPIEWFEGGVWTQVRQYRCVELRKGSVGAAGLTVQGYPGRRFRMRAEFEGDDTNTASAGPWREFTFRR